MHHILKWVLVALVGLVALETAIAQSPPPEHAKYWIFFVDRGGAETLSRYAPTPEALARRARRGSAAPSSVDYHVAPQYVTALQELGVDPLVESRWLNAVSASLSEAQRRSVSELKFVRRLHPVGRTTEAHSNRTDEVSTFTLSPRAGPLALDYGASEVQLALVNATPPLESGIDGSGVRLGFLDASFMGLEHPSMQHLFLNERARFREFTGREQGGSHGLSVVSVAAGYAPGELIGPAHGAHILAATTEYVPSETNAEEDYFVAGLEWLEAMGADVVSASIGYTTFDPGERDYTPADLDGDTGVTTRAADRAASLGIAFVAAAGNEGCSSPDFCWYFVNTPADGDSVIAVGGVTANLSRSSFSSFGPTADGRIKPDVAAMGTGVYIAVPGGEYAHSSGTSFAAPMVAGIVAQMLQANPSLNPAEVADILRQTASQAENPDSALGWGIVDADAAVRIAIDLSAEEEPPTETLSAEAYPNPATDYLFIHIKARGMDRPAVRLYDVLGRSVETGNADIRYPSRDLISLKTANLPPGVYIYTIEADRTRASGKFVVVR